jgi:hypothetical protein
VGEKGRTAEEEGAMKNSMMDITVTTIKTKPRVMHVPVTVVKTKPRKMTLEVTYEPMFDEKKIRRTIADCSRESASKRGRHGGRPRKKAR